MSFASTVSSVIEVPPTHSSGVARSDRPGRRRSRPRATRTASRPGRGCGPRWAGPRARGAAARTTISTAATPPAPAERDAAAVGTTGEADAQGALVNASTTMIMGDPIVGMRTNGMTRLPRIAPVVFTPSSRPGLGPGLRRDRRAAAPRRSERRIPSRSSPGGRSGRRRRTGRRSTPAVAGSSDAWLRDDQDQSGDAEDRHGDLRARRGRGRVLDPRAERVERGRAERDADQEQGQDDREDVGQPARSRREQPGPRDLVAKRGQAGDERDDQGQPDDRRRRRSGCGRPLGPAPPGVGRDADGLRATGVSASGEPEGDRPAMPEHSAPTRVRRSTRAARSARDRPAACRRRRPACWPNRAARTPGSSAAERVKCRTRAGKVAPIMIVAGASARTARTRRARARQRACPRAPGRCRGRRSLMSPNVSGVTSTTTTSASSSRPYRRSGERTRSAIRPPTVAPIAMPPKNPVRMAETACVVFPKTRTSWRDQTIS